MTDKIKIKNGETFIFDGMLTEDDDVTPIDLTNVVIESQIRTAADVLVDDLIVTVMNAATGEFRLETSISTSAWAKGNLFMDVKSVIDGVTIITDTITIIVDKAITH